MGDYVLVSHTTKTDGRDIEAAAASSHMEQKPGEPAQEQTHSITASRCDVYGTLHDYIMITACQRAHCFGRFFHTYLFICLISKRRKPQKHKQ